MLPLDLCALWTGLDRDFFVFIKLLSLFNRLYGKGDVGLLAFSSVDGTWAPTCS